MASVGSTPTKKSAIKRETAKAARSAQITRTVTMSKACRTIILSIPSGAPKASPELERLGRRVVLRERNVEVWTEGSGKIVVPTVLYDSNHCNRMAWVVSGAEEPPKAPTPNATVKMATAVKAGDFRSWRKAKRQSERTEWSQFPIRSARTCSFTCSMPHGSKRETRWASV